MPTVVLSMITKYYNHKLQTKPRHREEEPHNNHETPGRQTKQSNQLSLPIEMIDKLEWTHLCYSFGQGVHQQIGLGQLLYSRG